MTLKVLDSLDYTGDAGMQQVQALQLQLIAALHAQDWHEVRRLDNACAALVDRVIAANTGNKGMLIAALNELKGVYSHLLTGCQVKVASMAV